MTRSDQLFDQFEKFHRANPKVWNLFVSFTNQLLAAGHAHYSADAVLHRIRWESAIQTGGSSFKLNNNLTSLYARLFAVKFPQHAKFFRLRHRNSEQKPERPDALEESTNADDEIDNELRKKLLAL